MSGGVPHGDRRVKFTELSMAVLGKWAEDATDEDHEAVNEALMRVVEGTWRDHYNCQEDFAQRLTWHITVTSNAMITVRFAMEYPTFAQLVAIRKPPPIEFPW